MNSCSKIVQCQVNSVANNNWEASKSNNHAARPIQSKGLFTSIKYNTMTLTVDCYLSHLT